MEAANTYVRQQSRYSILFPKSVSSLLEAIVDKQSRRWLNLLVSIAVKFRTPFTCTLDAVATSKAIGKQRDHFRINLI
jgi:hypothetical protein